LTTKQHRLAKHNLWILQLKNKPQRVNYTTNWLTQKTLI